MAARNARNYQSLGNPEQSSTAPSDSQYEGNLTSNVTTADIRKSLEGALYDTNGIRLDRTPTDEEINWLWDTVRTCLSRQSTVDSTTDAQSDRSASRQGVQIANKHIDVHNLPAQSRPSRTGTITKRTGNGVPSEAPGYNSPYGKKISMEKLNTYNSRTNNATQRRTSSVNTGFNKNRTWETGDDNSVYLTHPRHGSARGRSGPYQSPSITLANGHNAGKHCPRNSANRTLVPTERLLWASKLKFKLLCKTV